MSVWYLASPTELLLDLDEYMRPAPGKDGSRGPWGEIFFRRRLRNAMLAGRLNVSRVHLIRSTSALHWHAFVLLAHAMPLMERLIWQLQLGSDLMRARSDLMRATRGIKHPSLLIRDTPIPSGPNGGRDFWRTPDRQCFCTTKHVTEQQAALGQDACPVWRELRGQTPWELFGPPAHGLERGVCLPEGDVPLADILRINLGD